MKKRIKIINIEKDLEKLEIYSELPENNYESEIFIQIADILRPYIHSSIKKLEEEYKIVWKNNNLISQLEIIEDLKIKLGIENLKKNKLLYDNYILCKDLVNLMIEYKNEIDLVQEFKDLMKEYTKNVIDTLRFVRRFKDIFNSDKIENLTKEEFEIINEVWRHLEFYEKDIEKRKQYEMFIDDKKLYEIVNKALKKLEEIDQDE